MDRAKLGAGIGLRPVHYSDFLSSGGRSEMWCEVISENYMYTDGKPFRILEQVRELVPISLHGVALSVGSQRSGRKDYISRLKNLMDAIQPWIVSDHFCFTGLAHTNSFDLLPLPLTHEAIQEITNNIDWVQNTLGRRVYFENISSYIGFKDSEMAEVDFINEIVARTGCGLLLDVNNVYVSSRNFGWDAWDYIERLNMSAVGEIHLAGHSQVDDFLFDTHDHPVCQNVWSLYQKTVQLAGAIPTLIEWDEALPTFDRLMEERAAAQAILRRSRREAGRDPEKPAGYNIGTSSL